MWWNQALNFESLVCLDFLSLSLSLYLSCFIFLFPLPSPPLLSSPSLSSSVPPWALSSIPDPSSVSVYGGKQTLNNTWINIGWLFLPVSSSLTAPELVTETNSFFPSSSLSWPRKSSGHKQRPRHFSQGWGWWGGVYWKGREENLVMSLLRCLHLVSFGMCLLDIDWFVDVRASDIGGFSILLLYFLPFWNKVQ